MRKKQIPIWEVFIYRKKEKLLGGYEKILAQRYLSTQYKAPKEREFVIVEVIPRNRKARLISEKKESK